MAGEGSDPKKPCKQATLGPAVQPVHSSNPVLLPNRCPIGSASAKQKSPAFAGLSRIGAPGFEPGTSPTRIMGEIRGRCKKYLQIDRFQRELTSSQFLGFSGGFPGFRQ